MKEFFTKMADCLVLLLWGGAVFFGIACFKAYGVIVGLAVLAACALAFPSIKRVFKHLTTNYPKPE